MLIFKLPRFCCLIVACCLSPSLLTAAPAKGPEPARVAILEFNDNTGQASYGWVKTSLPDAINDSMKAHFEFARADAAEAGKNSAKILGQAKEYSPEMIGEMAKQYNFDIVIFGDYNYDAKTKLAKITASVYHRDGKRIIGSATEQTKLNNDVFTKIDVISKKIVEHIYRFSLDLSEQEAAKRREEGIRLMVLVPAWTNDAQKKAATNELEVQKKELKKKYPAEFITIFEFFKSRKTSAGEQKTVEGFAQARNDGAIAEWLKSQKVTNAMIVFVSGSKVNLRPVVEGSPRATVVYDATATPDEKAKIIQSAVSASGMNKNLEKTTVTKTPGIWGRFSLAGGGFYLKPVGSGGDAIDTSYGFELHALYRVFNLWVFQLGVAAAAQGTTQRHTRADGDEDFVFRRYAAMGGPVMIVPMPFYRALEFHFTAAAGGAYSMLDKYKYVDATLSFKSFNPVAMGGAEIRWHIWRGLFIGVAASYQRVFFSGTDMEFITASARAGYRF